MKAEPYWWEHAAPWQPDPEEWTQLPDKAEVLIIGSGYTGLHSALQTARGGRRTVIVDAERAGWGCSTRNGGQISTSIKPSLSELQSRYGDKTGEAILREGQASLDFMKSFVEAEKLDCDFKVAGRFFGAHNPKAYERLGRLVDAKSVPGLETGAYVVPKESQHNELGTESYHGGAVFPAHASLQPAKYHRGLVDLVRQAGATIVPDCPALGITREKAGFTVETGKGRVTADKVVIATNGYTGPLTPWQRRRVIPIGSYVIATDPIPSDVMERLMPTDRNIVDTRRVVFYYRRSPDRTRVVFGGRVSAGETDPAISGKRLHRHLVGLFPELAATGISHSWMGFVAYTFDHLMHMGDDDGLHYALGYCGSGVGFASYLGMRMGQQVLGLPEGRTPFNDIPFPTRPLYTGKPWFLGPTVAFYSLLDRMGF